MKKLLYLFLTVLIVACSDDDGNPCLYNPTLTTSAVTNITETSATLNGVISIVSENCDDPNNTEQGFVYATTIQPTIANTKVNVNGTDVTTTLENLEPNTTYYVRTFLTNALGEFYGNEVSFMTTEEPVNCDGNPIPSIVYETQEWTVENACHITYRDGTPIPEVTDGTAWQNLTTGAWSYYDNDSTKPRLYNWYAVMGIHDNNPNTPNKEFAPEGWHVPSNAEWTTLEEHLIANGFNYDGTTTGNKIAKAMASTTGWNSSTEPGAPGNDQSLNNDSGFNAPPEGFRSQRDNFPGFFGGEGLITYFWSSTPILNTSTAWFYALEYTTSILISTNDNNKWVGFSVRFVRD